MIDMLTGEDIGLSRLGKAKPWILYDLPGNVIVSSQPFRPIIDTKYREAYRPPDKPGGLWLRANVHHDVGVFPDSVHEKDVPEVVRLAATLLE